jgi:hypothetical protein
MKFKRFLSKWGIQKSSDEDTALPMKREGSIFTRLKRLIGNKITGV